ERAPLLGDSAALGPRRTSFYRARPLWLVPFAIIAALVRGMTLAPRVEVFTQLACSQVYPSHSHAPSTLVEAPVVSGALEPVPLWFPAPFGEPGEDDGDDGDPRQLPSRCALDPAVLVVAGKSPTRFTTTVSLLSILTTGWWGPFGDRHGRTKVLAIAAFGLFFTDLAFTILASTRSAPFSAHGDKLLFIASVIEGLLGGWLTLQSSTLAYVADCTASGSKASIFSRFAGLTILGFSVGSAIGRWLIRHLIAFLSGAPHMSVLWVAAICSCINFCFVLFVVPEPVGLERRDLAPSPRRGESSARSEAIAPAVGARDAEQVGILAKAGAITGSLLRPLAIFLPLRIFVPGSTRQRRDWSLPLLVCALVGYQLVAGVFPFNYLYGLVVYQWGSKQLAAYSTFIGAGYALFLLFVFPLVVSALTRWASPPPADAPTALDLRLVRLALFGALVAHAAVALVSAEALFVGASALAHWVRAGAHPAAQSFVLGIVQARARAELPLRSAPADAAAGIGSVLAAFAVLQAGMLFGLIYSRTVAVYPKAVFFAAVAVLAVALAVTLGIR
ncbi:hypothetical protein FB451DRAFT_990518, partial [Mycena latifolia]